MKEILYILTEEELEKLLTSNDEDSRKLPEPIAVPDESEISNQAHSLNLVTIQRWQSYYDGAKWAVNEILKTKRK